MKWTEEQLHKQRDEILSEMNFHKVRDFKIHNEEREESIKNLREQLKFLLDAFIAGYMNNHNVSTELSSGGWYISFDMDIDHRTPLLHAEYSQHVTESSAFEFWKDLSEQGNHWL